MKLAWMLFLIASGPTLAGTIDPGVPDAKYVAYGTQFGCVARIICSADDKHFSASCVVVSERHVLTAAHVVSQASEWRVLLDNGEEHRLYRCVVHPEFLSPHERDKGEFDIAVGTTDREFRMNFYPAMYSDGDEEGKVVSMAGYGFHGTFDTGLVGLDGKRRGGSNIITLVDRDTLICSNSDKPKTSLEFLITSGDSGGGLFIGNKLAGVHSSIMATGREPSGKHGEESSHTRISSHLDWIVKEMSRD